jgi:uncharacterized RDD family membrane protein YckC
MSTAYENPQQIDMGNHWMLRFVAALIDSIPFAIVGYIISYVLIWNPGSPLFFWGYGLWWLTYFLIWPLLYGIPLFIYSFVMESSASQATFGKKIIGLKVEMLNGSKPPSGKVMTRNLSKILWFVFLIDVLIGIATQGPDRRQRYFDRMAGTTVVQTKQSFMASASPPPPPPPPPT